MDLAGELVGKRCPAGVAKIFATGPARPQRAKRSAVPAVAQSKPVQPDAAAPPRSPNEGTQGVDWSLLAAGLLASSRTVPVFAAAEHTIRAA